MCCRSTVSLKSMYVVQVGFFSIVGIPQFKAMTDLFEDAKPMLEGVLENYHRWEVAATAAGL